MFLSARPGRGATQRPRALGGLRWFLSARPGRGATTNGRYIVMADYPVSIRTPRAGRDKALCQTCATDISVSIRTPRAGRDAPRAGRAEMAEMVSIRTPRAGRDLMFSHDTYSTAHLFLSARPGRGATNGRYIVMADYPVSIRTPRAGRDPATASAATCWQSFYPHAPGGARHQLLHRCRHLGSSFYPHAPGGARRAGARNPQQRS